MNKFDGNSFICDRGCEQLIFWKENQHIFVNAYDGVGGDQGNRHACPNRGGWSKGTGSTEPLKERTITAKDLEIAQCNPKKHNYIPEILANIYGSVLSDRWLCRNCKLYGDKWYMMVHECEAYYQIHYNSKTTQKLNKKKSSD